MLAVGKLVAGIKEYYYIEHHRAKELEYRYSSRVRFREEFLLGRLNGGEARMQ